MCYGTRHILNDKSDHNDDDMRQQSTHMGHLDHATNQVKLQNYSPSNFGRGSTGTGAEAKNMTQEANDCFFKIIDIPFNGNPIKTQNECYTKYSLTQMFSRVPDQEENTIRVILEGAGEGDSETLEPDYPTCGIRYPRRRSKGSMLYHIGSSRDPRSTHDLPAFRRMWDPGARQEWYYMQCFAGHDHDCPHVAKRAGRYGSDFELPVVQLGVDWTKSDTGRITGMLYCVIETTTKSDADGNCSCLHRITRKLSNRISIEASASDL
jgi:hypothetical protein